MSTFRIELYVADILERCEEDQRIIIYGNDAYYGERVMYDGFPKYLLDSPIRFCLVHKIIGQEDEGGPTILLEI